jgi:hypothetical protein
LNNQLAILASAIVLIVVGIILYVHSDDNFAACQSTIGGIVRALDPGSARDCANVKTQHYASIAIMLIGGVALLAGFIPAKKAA